MTSRRPAAGTSPQVQTALDVGAFRRRILTWYGRFGRDLPWRSPDADPYAQVVAEVLLQRTRAETVAAFYSRFFTRFPHWGALAAATTRQLQGFLKPIGLWRRRATGLQRLAAGVLELGGRVPAERSDLEQLPAVGQYVASAAMLFYHGKPEPLLDSGMARVIERHFGPRALADIRYDPYLQALAREIVRGPRAKDTNWAILDLAALVCQNTPLCGICPVVQTCSFARTVTTRSARDSGGSAISDANTRRKARALSTRNPNIAAPEQQSGRVAARRARTRRQSAR